MDKNLTVYPISSGDILNIFAADDFSDVTIKDMAGNVVLSAANLNGSQRQIDIQALQNATYIVEIVYVNHKVARSVFVKM